MLAISRVSNQNGVSALYIMLEICKVKIVELIIDMTVNSTVNNKKLKHFVLGTSYENLNP